VRQTGVAGTPSESGVVLCSRLPRAAAQYNCLLIDVSTLYADGQSIVPGTSQSSTTTKIMVLKRWRFVSASEPHSFARYMDGLLTVAPGPGPLCLPKVPGRVDPDLRRAGYVLLPIRWRDGNMGAALYRGPLSGAQPSLVAAPPALQRPDPYKQVTADALMEFHEVTGLFDVSYAAAWELGRLLAMASGGMAAALAAYNRDASDGRV
jgi:hypothetical protein